jgi:pimeloyl-ACP methyl ester carboxylesterase
MKHIETNQLCIAYWDIGPSNGKPIFLMHGFPYDVHSYDVVSERLAEQGFRCIVPFLRGYGPTTFKSPDILRSGQQAALGSDLLSLMDALDVPEAFVGGYDWGGRAACIVAALWPERVYGLVSCGVGYNIQNIAKARNPAPPAEEYRYWYQYYFHTERGRAGLSLNRHELCELIWRLWSPTWKFDEATFNQTAMAFDNPDFVEIVIHSYRHRFGGISGDPTLDEIESKLVDQPNITVPSIVLLGGDDGVDPPMTFDDDAPHFTGRYERQIVSGAGHNLPQEMPGAFVDAVVALS